MSQKGASKTIILIAVILIGGGVMFYLGIQYQGSTANDNNNVNTVVNAATNTNSEAASDEQYTVETGISGELIFINRIYNYRITLPDDWVVDPVWTGDFTGDLERTSFFDSVAMEDSEATELMQGMKIEVYVQPLEPGTTLDDIEASQVEGMQQYVLEQKDTSVDGVAAKKIITEMLGYNISTHVIRDNYWLIIVGYIGDIDDKEAYEVVYSRILSDFRFLN